MLRILGIVVAVVGVVLLIMGLNATNSFTESVGHTVTGQYSNTTTYYIVGGIAAIVGGSLLAFFGGSSRSRGSIS